MLTHYCVLPMQDVSAVEADLLNILQGGAPMGFEYHDVEEEYVIDPATNVGSWQRAKPAAEATAPAAAAAAAVADVGGSGQAAAGAATAGGPLAAIGPADGGQEAAAGSTAGGSKLRLKAKIPGLAKKAKVAPTPSPPQPH